MKPSNFTRSPCASLLAAALTAAIWTIPVSAGAAPATLQDEAAEQAEPQQTEPEQSPSDQVGPEPTEPAQIEPERAEPEPAPEPAPTCDPPCAIDENCTPQGKCESEPEPEDEAPVPAEKGSDTGATPGSAGEDSDEIDPTRHWFGFHLGAGMSGAFGSYWDEVSKDESVIFSGGVWLDYDYHFSEDKRWALFVSPGTVSKGLRRTFPEDESFEIKELLMFIEIPVGVKRDFDLFEVGLAAAVEWGLYGKSYEKKGDLQAEHVWDEDRWERLKYANLGLKLVAGSDIGTDRYKLFFGIDFTMHPFNDLRSEYLEEAGMSDLHSRYFNLMLFVGGKMTPKPSDIDFSNCRQVYKTGSRIPEWFCTGPGQRDEDRTADDQLELERIQRHRYSGGPGN